MGKDAQVDVVRAALAPRYRVDRELGRGGMAIVYLARDATYDRPVAIKVLHPELAAVVGTDRFEREIRLAARLQHPHIPPLLDSGTAHGLFYYVMPFVAGESLRERIAHQKQLPIVEALRITREVADALSLAHRTGVVHRDIKPSNILLEGDHAVVADFGIAHLLSEVGDEAITSSGLTVGSPGYMSPEQAGGSLDLDGRSDLYSLGCVLYEMLAGEAPYTGPTPQAIMAKQVSLPIPSVVTVRDTVPEAVDRILARLLAKVPADRYASADELLAALETVSTDQEPARQRGPRQRSRRRWGALTVVLAVVGAMLALGYAKSQRGGTEGLLPDTTRYAILPFRYGEGVAPLNEVQLLSDALTRWSGLSVADQFQVNHALSVADSSGGDLAPVAAARVALDLGAGRFIRGEISAVGDSIRVHAGLYAASAGRPGALLSDHATRMTADSKNPDSLFAMLADYLLFRGHLPSGARAMAGTRPLGSRQAYQMGIDALNAWNLEAADTAFSRAASLDPEYAQAQLWLALVRAWRDADPGTWRLAAERAVLGLEGLSERDRGLARAVAAESHGDYGTACPIWRTLTEQQPRDFTTWYGLASCLRQDDAVLPDPASPSGYRFRTSYRAALSAYQRAFRLHSPVLASFGDSAFISMRRLLKTSPSALRAGRVLPPDSGLFAAYPGWEGDTLSLTPWPAADVSSLVAPRPHELASRHQREAFREIALAWASEAQGSSAALEALALSLEMLGLPSALDTFRAARRLATTEPDRVRLTAEEVWLRVKLALPEDPDGLRAARSLADSALAGAATAPVKSAGYLASLASLTGRAILAASLSRRAGVEGLTSAPSYLARSGPAFLAFAALGGPTDSLMSLERSVATAIARDQDPARAAAARREWLLRPVSLTFPEWVPDDLSSLSGQDDYLVDMQAAWSAGDTATVRGILNRLRRVRANYAAASVTADGLYPEIGVLLELGDSADARARLEEYLRSLRDAPPGEFMEVARAGVLVRALALAAILAEGDGERETARRWAAAVVILWDRPDAFLAPMVARMRQLVDAVDVATGTP